MTDSSNPGRELVYECLREISRPDSLKSGAASTTSVPHHHTLSRPIFDLRVRTHPYITRTTANRLTSILIQTPTNGGHRRNETRCGNHQDHDLGMVATAAELSAALTAADARGRVCDPGGVPAGAMRRTAGTHVGAGSEEDGFEPEYVCLFVFVCLCGMGWG
jgi:hypothetical protein